MSNFIFTSHFQKRFENGNLTAVSEKDYREFNKQVQNYEMSL